MDTSIVEGLECKYLQLYLSGQNSYYSLMSGVLNGY